MLSTGPPANTKTRVDERSTRDSTWVLAALALSWPESEIAAPAALVSDLGCLPGSRRARETPRRPFYPILFFDGQSSASAPWRGLKGPGAPAADASILPGRALHRLGLGVFLEGSKSSHGQCSKSC